MLTITAADTRTTQILAGIGFQQSSFGSCSALNTPERSCKVVSGYNFVGDSYAGTRQGPAPVAGGQPVGARV